MSTALIQPKILEWAIKKSDIDISLLASRIPTKTEKITEWESGVSHPTFVQAQKLAKILKVPFGYFFLETPPDIDLAVPDLRTVNSHFRDDMSADLHDVVSDVMRKQSWYRQIKIDNGYERIPFIGKFNPTDSTIDIAKDIEAILELSGEDRNEVRNWKEFLNLLVQKAESSGLWVLRSGKVGSNTHRVLNVDEFRGFVLSDEYAPAVFINGADAKAAQIFTLIHELAHLWIGQSGISDYGVNFSDNSHVMDIERKCNEIAAEVLIPSDLFKGLWTPGIDLDRNASDLSRYFRVSKIVVARRALDMNEISRTDYNEYYRMQALRWKNQKSAKSSGGDYYLNIPIANGRAFTDTVLQCVSSQNTLMRDGARLLGVSTSSLEKMAIQAGYF